MPSIYFIFLTSVEALLYLFHSSVLIVLSVNRNKNFHGSFFNLFRIVLVADIINFLSVVSIQKVSLLPFLHEFFETSLYVPSYILNLVSFTTVVQFMGHTMMAFNRFTLIWFSTTHTIMWKNKKWYILFLLTTAFLSVCFKIHQPATFKYLSDDRTSTTDLNVTISSISYTVRIMVYFSSTIISAILNVLTVVKLHFYKQSSNVITVNEKNLFSLSFIIFLAQCLRTSSAVAQFVLPSESGLRAFFSSAIPIIYDIYALSGSVTLLILSETTRKEYVKFFFPKKLNKTSFTTAIKMHPLNKNGTLPTAFQT